MQLTISPVIETSDAVSARGAVEGAIQSIKCAVSEDDGNDGLALDEGDDVVYQINVYEDGRLELLTRD